MVKIYGSKYTILNRIQKHKEKPNEAPKDSNEAPKDSMKHQNHRIPIKFQRTQMITITIIMKMNMLKIQNTLQSSKQQFQFC